MQIFKNEAGKTNALAPRLYLLAWRCNSFMVLLCRLLVLLDMHLAMIDSDTAKVDTRLITGFCPANALDKG